MYALICLSRIVFDTIQQFNNAICQDSKSTNLAISVVSLLHVVIYFFYTAVIHLFHRCLVL